MTSMLDTVAPKSDQLNADDLIGGRMLTIKITKVDIAMGEQPVSIHYEGDNGKPYKPGKSMRRVIINCWGADVTKYVGRSLTLYRDDKVVFAGAAVGGIRISHMSDISAPITMALTATRASRKPFTVKPIMGGVSSTDIPSIDDFIADMESAPTLDGLKHKYSQGVRAFTDDDSRKKLTDAKEKRKAELSSTEAP